MIYVYIHIDSVVSNMTRVSNGVAIVTFLCAIGANATSPDYSCQAMWLVSTSCPGILPWSGCLFLPLGGEGPSSHLCRLFPRRDLGPDPSGAGLLSQAVREIITPPSASLSSHKTSGVGERSTSVKQRAFTAFQTDKVCHVSGSLVSYGLVDTVLHIESNSAAGVHFHPIHPAIRCPLRGHTVCLRTPW